MSSAFGRAIDSFLSFFRSPAPKALPDLTHLQELSPADFQSRREIFPLYPLAGWDPVRIIQMLEAHDVGNFQASELFYHALNKEGLIGSAFEQRIAESQCIPWSLQCPKDAPDEFHVFSEALARDWQSVMPDDVRAEIIERMNVFGFQVCRLQWTWNNGQRQPRLIPYTHSSISYRQDLWCYQVQTEQGIEYISNDGRQWAIFSLGGTRPWLKGLIRRLAFVYFGIITGDDRWLNFNDKFAEPIKNRIIPRMMREQQEPQRLYSKESAMRGGDMVVSPQDEKGYGYDLKYVQVDAKGFETLQAQLARFDERAAIIILGHNLLQSVKGGSLAAIREAKKLLRARAIKDVKNLSAGTEPMSKVWARANFGTGTDASEWPELQGAPPETKTWALVFDVSDPDEKQAQAVMAAQFSQGFATFAKAAGPKLFELPIDWEEAAERAGIPMLSGEDSYTETDEEAELDGEEYVTPPAHVVATARRSLSWVQELRRGGTEVGRQMARKIVKGRLTRRDVARMAAYFPRHEVDKDGKDWGNLKRPSNGRIAWGLWGDNGDGRGRAWAEREANKLTTLDALPVPASAPQPLLLASGDPADSAAGLIEGQTQLDLMADAHWDAPGLAAFLAALAAAVDWSDLRARLGGIVRELDLTATEGALEDRLHQAAVLGRESVDHDLPAALRAEVGAADRKLSPREKLAEVQGAQRRQSRLAKLAASGFLFAVAKSLWERADRAADGGQPLELHRAELAQFMEGTWGKGGSLWDAIRVEPMQNAFTHGRVHRLNDPSLLAVFPYWRLDAVLDGRTTQLCRGLNGYTRPAGDPSFPIPPLHYHCRSTVRGIGRADGEASASAPLSVTTLPGFGGLDSYPEPETGPEELLRAYRERGRSPVMLTAVDLDKLPAIARRAILRATETTP